MAPVETELDGETVTVEEDEHPRPGTTVEKLSGLPPSFRGPENGFHHAGNSSGIVDGSGGLLVASEEAAAEHGWEPMARIVDTHVVGGYTRSIIVATPWPKPMHIVLRP